MGNERESGTDDDLTERLIDREVLHSSNYVTFVRDTVESPDGKRHIREVVDHPGAVTVMAVLSDASVLLVRQYRHAAGQVLLELPAGTLDRRPDGSIEDPSEAAQRELMEETGHRAGQWHKLARFWTAPGFATELMHLYLALDVAPDPDYDGAEEDERLQLVVMPFAELVARAERGEVRDAKTLVGIYAAADLARAGSLPELAAALGGPARPKAS